MTFEHFKRAVELAKKCKPEPDKRGNPYPKVGVVIVKYGKKVSEAYRGEIGVGQHAEYIALEKKAGDNPEAQRADLITTLEPCTTRTHNKRPCVSWIKSRNIRKVWIASLDHNPEIAGLGELELQKAGILIGRFPDELAIEVISDNKDFFEFIESRQPTISVEEQRTERSVIIDSLREHMMELSKVRELFFKAAREEKDADGIQNLTDGIDKLRVPLRQAIAIEYGSSGSWSQLGASLAFLGLAGSARLAYRIATRIDATNTMAWSGLVQSEIVLYRDVIQWPYLHRIEPIDSSPGQVWSTAWLRQELLESKYIIKLKILIRAVQLGQRSDLVWNRLRKLLDQDVSRSDRFAAAVPQHDNFVLIGRNRSSQSQTHRK